MRTFRVAVRRECRVAFSRQAQPVWFRIAKWTGLLTGAALYHDRPWSWWALAGLTVVAATVHLLYRRMTKTWTHAWGGWNDLAAGRD